jgi:hypothetical protein
LGDIAVRLNNESTGWLQSEYWGWNGFDGWNFNPEEYEFEPGKGYWFQVNSVEYNWIQQRPE